MIFKNNGKEFKIMTFGETMKFYRKRKKMTQVQLGAVLGLSDATISAYEKDLHSPDITGIRAIADALGVTTDVLMSGNSDPADIKNFFEVVPVPPQGMRPVVGLASAGRGVIAEEDIEGFETVDARFDSDEYFYIRVRGDSMAPQINDGDLVLVKRTRSVDSGAVGVFLVDHEEGYIKKVEYDAENISLISYNPYYPPLRFSGPDVLRVEVLGLAVSIKRYL